MWWKTWKGHSSFKLSFIIKQHLWFFPSEISSFLCVVKYYSWNCCSTLSRWHIKFIKPYSSCLPWKSMHVSLLSRRWQILQGTSFLIGCKSFALLWKKKKEEKFMFWDFTQKTEEEETASHDTEQKETDGVGEMSFIKNARRKCSRSYFEFEMIPLTQQSRFALKLNLKRCMATLIKIFFIFIF